MAFPQLSLEKWLQSGGGTFARRLWDRLPRPARASLLHLYPLPRFRVGVLAVIVNSRGEVLLLDHRFRASDPWGVPGGWLERLEAPEEGLLRELREELAHATTPDALELMEVVSRTSRSHLEFFYGLRADIDDIPPNVEFKQARYFPLDALPAEMLPLHREVVLRAARRLRARG